MPSSGRIRNPARLPQLAAIAASPPRAVDGPGLRQRRADVANRPAGPDVGAKGETIVAERFLCVGENGEDALGAGHGFSCLPPVRQSFMQSLGIRPKQRAGQVEGSASGRIVLLCGPHPVLVPHLLRAFRSRAAGSSGKPLLASVRSAKSRHGKSRACARTRRHEARRRGPFLRSRFACRFFCPDSNGSRVALPDGAAPRKPGRRRASAPPRTGPRRGCSGRSRRRDPSAAVWHTSPPLPASARPAMPSTPCRASSTSDALRYSGLLTGTVTPRIAARRSMG
jgi:hypothetical protein